MMGVAFSPKKWTFKTWDTLELPKPFSKVYIVYGKGINIDFNPENQDDESIKKVQLLVENRLKEIEENLISKFKI